MTLTNGKYELLWDDKKNIGGITVYRIRALVAIGLFVAAGDLGGYVASEKNLCTSGNSWIFGNAAVLGNAVVLGNSHVCGNAHGEIES